jgi:hypothetical protein
VIFNNPKVFYEKSHPTREDFGEGIDTKTRFLSNCDREKYSSPRNPVSAMDGKIFGSESGISDTDRKFQVNMEK